MKVKDTLIFSAILTVSIAVSFFIGRFQGRRSVETPQADTITIVKEISAYRPKETARIELGKVKIPAIYVMQEPADTLKVPDTVLVEVEREQKHYRQEGVWECYVSGIDVALDSMKVQQVERVVTIVPPAVKHHRAFIRGEVGYYGSFGAPILAGYGYEWKFVTAWGGAGYDPIRKAPVVGVGLDLSLRW